MDRNGNRLAVGKKWEFLASNGTLVSFSAVIWVITQLSPPPRHVTSQITAAKETNGTPLWPQLCNVFLASVRSVRPVDLLGLICSFRTSPEVC